MPSRTNDISTGEIYELIDNTRKELKTDMAQTSAHLLATIQRVEQKFDTMEAGRLTRLEKDYAELKAQVRVQSATDKPVINRFNKLTDYILLAVVMAILGLVLIKQ